MGLGPVGVTPKSCGALPSMLHYPEHDAQGVALALALALASTDDVQHGTGTLPQMAQPDV